jgi:hypothetical protein
MRPSPVPRHHPLAAAGTALEHLILRHFGFQVMRSETNESPPKAAKDAADAHQA